MSGHNRWSQIKHKKDITDAKKSKIFSKLVRFISVEAKLSGGKDSPGLRAAIEKAKKVNMPAENIERAIKKASEPGAHMDAITYEAYGPGGVGIIIETLTDSKNRTAQDIKHILTKNGFALGGIGSVTWAFSAQGGSASGGKKWVPKTTIPLSDADLELLDKLVEELEENDDVQDVYTNAE
ncbi:MAG: transcriptional regulator [Candidatus Nomurabacteria bacterium GW2011_GWF2_43_8]|uniref:Transcriptional regulator n=3 Tax=Candidatus Nomuraibacteriota TaxID=1752729 RepID=A0A0G1IFQ0_9BACT|nr:MAG: transcriptional regulator [Candidatus Nomurabacteria bacterium GW2011_GWA2_43_15]KKT18961.1 MAG: transcriptional regulator [Candidatus Nomurabacteria bacterium GW2011_GWB1_43_7]KKT22004.1 MAG: transcriptional regulator [Candidatus Nomurabacteria bacterium GW2011_GWF2_43_8]